MASLLAGVLIATPGPGLFSNDLSPQALEYEVDRAVVWLEEVLTLATLERSGLTIDGYAQSEFPRPIKITWAYGNRVVKYESNRIAFAAERSSSAAGPQFHSFTPDAGTLTPALRFRIYANNHGYFSPTSWYITVSGYGYVRKQHVKSL